MTDGVPALDVGMQILPPLGGFRAYLDQNQTRSGTFYQSDLPPMDLTSSWVLSLMLLVGGGVALLADHLGRVLGKKRLRLGKLRPKHTAMLMTAITGFAVTLVTVILVITISAEAREWIRDGRQAIKNGKEAGSRLVETTQSLNEALEAKRSASIALEETNKELERSRKGVRGARQETAQLGKSIESLKRQISGDQRTLAATRKSLAGLKTQFQKVQGSLSNLNTSYEALSNMREEAEKEVERLQGELSKSESAMKLSASERLRIERELEARRSDLRDAQQRFREAEELFQKNLKESSAKLADTQNTLSQLENLARAAIDRSRDEPIVFLKGEEMARLAIESSHTRENALTQLNRAMSIARNLSDQRNAVEPGREPSVGFFEYRMNDGRTIGVLEQINLVLDAILRDAQPKVIIIRAPFNIFRTERVLVQVSVLPNPVVFREGAVIAEMRIDGTQSEDRILADVQGFLRNQVKTAATRAKMIPVNGSEANFGEVSSEDILRLINQIRAFGRPVRLQAIAVSETRASGPLELDFRLR